MFCASLPSPVPLELLPELVCIVAKHVPTGRQRGMNGQWLVAIHGLPGGQAPVLGPLAFVVFFSDERVLREEVLELPSETY